MWGSRRCPQVRAEIEAEPRIGLVVDRIDIPCVRAGEELISRRSERVECDRVESVVRERLVAENASRQGDNPVVGTDRPVHEVPPHERFEAGYPPCEKYEAVESDDPETGELSGRGV